MAFDITALHVALDTIGGGSIRIHFYVTSDDESTVTSAGYLEGVGARGVRKGDVVVVYSETGGVSASAYMATVSEIDATGNATLIVDRNFVSQYENNAAVAAAQIPAAVNVIETQGGVTAGDGLGYAYLRSPSPADLQSADGAHWARIAQDVSPWVVTPTGESEKTVAEWLADVLAATGSGGLVSVAGGGTGASTAAGARTNLGAQQASAILTAIAAGAIDGLPVGQTTPAAGAFTSLSVGDVLTIENEAQFANGTVLDPAITFTADGDTGFYRIGPNTIGVALGGSEEARFSAGTAAPDSQTVITREKGDLRYIQEIEAATTGKALLASASAATARAVLGLGALATKSVTAAGDYGPASIVSSDLSPDLLEDIESGGATNALTFDASGTYTPSANAVAVLITAWGAGGGGSGANPGDGGGGGGVIAGLYLASQFSSSHSISIGAGGSVNAAGGSTTVNGLLAAGGGAAGNGTRAGGSPSVTLKPALGVLYAEDGGAGEAVGGGNNPGEAVSAGAGGRNGQQLTAA
ncbi:MAG: hypothetical protein AAFR47_02295, partial [Pseudomonadota bacterium]